MGMMLRRLSGCARCSLASLVVAFAPLANAAETGDPVQAGGEQDLTAIQVEIAAEDAELRAARWQDLKQTIFGERELHDGRGVLRLDAPQRALDAAIVPIGLELIGNEPIKGVYLVIDSNPSPLAAHFIFGPKAEARRLSLRVRVDQYTNVHAIAESGNGRLYEVEEFVKAAGGCSAPAGADDAEALKELGRMKLRLAGEFAPGRPMQAQLMIRHPNYSGMQMDQVTRHYTPAHYIRSIDIAFEGEQVLHLDADISLSTDPVITFGFVPDSEGRMQVIARDNKNTTFDQTFDVPQS